MCVCVQSLQGSGPGGRVIAQDVSTAPAVVAAAPTPVYAPGEWWLATTTKPVTSVYFTQWKDNVTVRRCKYGPELNLVSQDMQVSQTRVMEDLHLISNLYPGLSFDCVIFLTTVVKIWSWINVVNISFNIPLICKWYSITSCDLILLFVFSVTGAEFTDIPLSNVRKASVASMPCIK